MPRRIKSRKMASELQEGPTVQMILARRSRDESALAGKFF